MDVVGGLVVMSPLVGLMVLLVLRTRQLWPSRPSVRRWDRPGPGRRGDATGVREPRRPLVPAGAQSVALLEPPPRRRQAS